MDHRKQKPLVTKSARLKRPLIITLLIVLIVFGAIARVFYQQVKPQCTILGHNSFNQNDGFNNKDLISLAHSLGAKDPIKACWGGLSNATSMDGVYAAIRITGANIETIAKTGCPVRPLSDMSNAGWVNTAYAGFGNDDRITGYYSPEGSKCHGGGKVDIILSGIDSFNKNVIYIVFYEG